MLPGKRIPSNIQLSLSSSAVKILRDHCRRSGEEKKAPRGIEANRVPGQVIVPEYGDTQIRRYGHATIAKRTGKKMATDG